MIIAIDGPSGAGKSTLAKRLAKDLGCMYLDTGAMYRALALKVLNRGLQEIEESALCSLVQSTDIDLVVDGDRAEVFLDGKNVSGLIRTPEVSQMASRVSALEVVRRRMSELQRALGRRGKVVAEGRDIGTVIFPQADVKIYLEASAMERALRRSKELAAAGREATFEDTLREIEERDKRDSERDLAPLRKAADAIVIDSSTLTADQVAQRVMEEVRRKLSVN